jgi:hypothetical protein
MSFLTILKGIGHVLQVGVTDVAPFAPLIGAVPVVGPIFTTVFQSIFAVEQIITPANSGAAKKAAAIQLINAVHPGLDPAALGAAIDAVVAALNSVEAAIGKLPVPATPAA